MSDNETDRKRGRFQFTGSVTGRLATPAPSFEELPGTLGDALAKRAENPAGAKVVTTDLAAIELRMLAQMTEYLDPPAGAWFYDREDKTTVGVQEVRHEVSAGSGLLTTVVLMPTREAVTAGEWQRRVREGRYQRVSRPRHTG